MRDLFLAVLLLGICSWGVAEDRGKLDGARWRYSMKPVAGRSEPRHGAFRISGDKIFQGMGKQATQVGTIIGKVREKPDPNDKVRVKFTNLRARDGSKVDLSGPVFFQSFGEVTGRLIDGDGKHWNFEASRVQE